MRLRLMKCCWRAVALMIGSMACAFAQPSASQPSNSLLRLLRSQPQIDVSSPVHASASFDPPVVRPGEKAVYRVRLNALEASIRWPAEITNVNGLKLDGRARGQILRFSGGKYRPLTCFNYRVRPLQSGHFIVPAFTVRVYGKPVVIPEARLKVRAGLAGPHESVRKLLVEPSATNVYLGQPLKIRVMLPASALNRLQVLTQVKLNGQGFLVNNNAASQSIKPMVRNGHRLATYIYETEVTPIVAGRVKLSAQGFTAGRRFSGPIVIRGRVTIPGGPPDYVLLDSDPITLHVRPLPSTGQLPGFTGGVGSFQCDDPKVTPDTVRVGNPVELSITLHGDTDPSRLVPPPAPKARDWQIFPGEIQRAGKGATLAYTLIPLTTEAQKTPAIPFSCFDPSRGAYVDLTIPPLPVSVTPDGSIKTDAWLMNSSPHQSASESTPALSDLAQSPGWSVGSLVPLQLRSWFAWMQLVPGFAFAGLWMWDRRRRHFEAHPGLWRRRQARRDLRRERRRLQRAAAQGDYARFARSAVTALRIACAPRYSAEPGALVCGDVVKTLGATADRDSSGDIVRQFFTAVDSSSFAVSPADADNLIPLQPDVERILTKLEEEL